MNCWALAVSRLATAVIVPVCESAIAFQFFLLMAAVLSRPQRQSRVDMWAVAARRRGETERPRSWTSGREPALTIPVLPKPCPAPQLLAARVPGCSRVRLRLIRTPA